MTVGRRDAMDAIHQQAVGQWPADQQTLIGAFVDHYYGMASGEDFADRSAADLFGAAAAHYRLGERRRGDTHLRVYNPEASRDGWASDHTAIQLVTDDRPFLVDSLSMAVNEQGLMVHRLVHPVLEVDRRSDGAIIDVCDDADAAGRAEAWIHLEVDRQAEPGQLAALEQALRAALSDVKAAVDDWPAMAAAADKARQDLQNQPPGAMTADLAEVDAFLQWLVDDHFTFLGYRCYALTRQDDALQLELVPDTGLGILRDDETTPRPSQSFTALPPSEREQALAPDPLILTKSSRRATVHRAGYMDSIGVKRFNADGEVIGEHRFLGLYTSAAYSRNPRHIPLLRKKVGRVLDDANLRPRSHAGKALLHILDTYPRDELFQIDSETLRDTAMGILQLQERQRTRLFLRHDPFGRFVSCLVYTPRDRYDTGVRQRMQAILMEAFGGAHSEFGVQLTEAVLARIHFIVHFSDHHRATVDTDWLESALAATTRIWRDDLAEALRSHFGEASGARLQSRYAEAFSAAYREDTEVDEAVEDIEQMQALEAMDGLVVRLYRPPQAGPGELRLKLYQTGTAIALSEVLPVLEHMGVRVIDERPYLAQPADGGQCWIHDFGLSADTDLATDTADLAGRFAAAFRAVWQGQAEDDGLNALLLTGLDWREVTVLRGYVQYLRQTGTPYSQAYIEATLAAHPPIATGLIRLFHQRFDPASADDSAAAATRETLATQLDAVKSLDEDRILRRLFEAVSATLRTNFYQRDADDRPRPCLALKLQPAAIGEMPKPVPAYEIFVTGPRVEGVHLRGGRVARGGLRFSERREDYRTEVLGLMKAQMVKNALIVPVGAKGGFIGKQLPGPREARQQAVAECYRLFVSSLLDITDNIVDDQVQPPPAVVRRDDDDPYLVVAADKGTASFSDIANEIAEAYGFWLHDAFASGGSTGYDHKAMGITARGAWVAVQRHFRELGHDIQHEPFTAVGIGDMSGDVFGNGMLQSRATRLVAAFDHRHVFIDPDPDAEVSYAERQRLFNQPGSTWADYDPDRISDGGGVWSRQDKSIPLSAPARRALAVDAHELTPDALIRAILCAPVDLLWNGGVGTYIKAADETHAEVGDKGNDAVRVDAESLRCRVIGEGGNLGVTALGRVAFALAGGRVNSDAIDNSGGVDCSDHEVNIKILLNGVMDDGELDEADRRELLAAMTEDVAAHVLANNDDQTRALSLMEDHAAPRLNEQARCMRVLERAGQLERAVEQLPDDEGITERQQRGLGLARPELSILLAYVKIDTYGALLDDETLDAGDHQRILRQYFPQALRERFGKRIDQHPLRREILATRLANHVLNRMGATFLQRVTEATGRTVPAAVTAFLQAEAIFELPALWDDIDALTGQVSAAHQRVMLHELCDLHERTTLWLLRHRRPATREADDTTALASAVARYRQGLDGLISPADQALIDERYARQCDAGVPASLAATMARLVMLYPVLDIHDAAAETRANLDEAARVHFAAARSLGTGALIDTVTAFEPMDDWQSRFRSGLLDSIHDSRRQVTEAILRRTPEADPAERVERWLAEHQTAAEAFRSTAEQVTGALQPEPAMLAVALQSLQQLTPTEAHPA
jgi:glutamate dehydrogenase